MGKIGIYFENKIVIILQSPFKTMYIGSAKSQLSCSFLNEKLSLELILQLV